MTSRKDQGWELVGDANDICITKGDQQGKFNIKIKIPKGAIYAMYIKIKGADNEEVTILGAEKHNPIKDKFTHALMVYINEADRRRSAWHLGY